MLSVFEAFGDIIPREGYRRGCSFVCSRAFLAYVSNPRQVWPASHGRCQGMRPECRKNQKNSPESFGPPRNSPTFFL